VCRITNVVDVPDKEYLIIDMDIAEGQFKEYFENRYVRFGGNWGCKKYQSYKEKALPLFKGFTTSVEESNDRYIWDFDETKLKGKMVGVIFGEEEYLTANDEIKIITKPQFFRSVKTIREGGFEIPTLKTLSSNTNAPQAASYEGTLNGVPQYKVPDNSRYKLESMPDFSGEVPF
jgi:hypothetical protein